MSSASPDQDDGSAALRPGRMVRPLVSEKTAVKLTEELYGVKVSFIEEMNSYHDRNFRIEVEPEHTNPHIEKLWPHGFTLKIFNSVRSQSNHVDAEHEMQKVLAEQQINCPRPVLNIYGKDKSKEKIYPDDDANQMKNGLNKPTEGCGKDVPYSLCLVRLLTFVPGKILMSVPYTPDLLYCTGKYVASLDKMLMGWCHTALVNHKSFCNLFHAPQLADLVYAVRDDNNKRVVMQVLKAFTNKVVPKYGHFKRGVIHADLNDRNLLVQEKSPSKGRDSYIFGVIDFADATESYYVFEAASSVTYMSIRSHIVDPLDVGGYILAGYIKEMPLNETEFECLKTCVAARFCQNLVCGEYTYMLDPSNDYVLGTAERGWPLLHRLWSTPEEELYARWRHIIKTYIHS